MENESAVGDVDIDGESLIDDLEDLEDELDSAAAQDEVRETQGLLAAASERGLIDSGTRRFDPIDALEAFVGSVIFASPLLVEDGVFDIADHLFQYAYAGIPVFLIANTLFVVFMTYALVEWTGKNREETQPLFNIIPVRVAVTLGVSFLVAAILMTVWGRVGDWQPLTEALARINVVWTVASLGAALGDILSESEDVAPIAPDKSPLEERQGESVGISARVTEVLESADEMSNSELVEAIHEQFDELEAAVEDPADKRRVQRLRDRTIAATVDGTFGNKIRKYTGRDIAEAFVGSIFFSVPFLVEDGVFDVAEYFLSFRVAHFPVFFIVNAVFVLLMIYMLVYRAGPQEVEMSRPVFGFIPRRLIGISLVSFLTAMALMTMWGRVAHWQDPLVALARISVVWSVASFGAALGDILPGESSGDDIGDELAAFEDLVGSVVEDRDE